jgi:UMF1 family MFS transporter
LLDKNKPSQVFSWAMFDFANTSFTVIVITVVFPLYFKDHVVNFETIDFLGFELSNPFDFFWGLAASLSFFFVALFAPVLGALSDFTSRKKKYIFYYSLICIAATVGISFLDAGDVFLAVLYVILGNVGFEVGLIYYDALLIQIATKEKYSVYSGYGYAAGYVGAIVSLFIALQFISNDGINPRVFLTSALFFAFFSVPFFLFVREKKEARVSNFLTAVKASLKGVQVSLKNLHYLPAIKQFVLSFFFYINGVLTVISFGGVYASSTLNFSTEEVIYFFLIVQFSAMIGSFLFGYLGKLIGEFKGLNIVLLLWILVCLLSFVAGFVEAKKLVFYIAGVLAGISLGSSQSLSRSYFSQMVPEGFEAEFFGFFALSGRFAAILGPLLFGLVSSFTGRQEFAVLSILIFFVLGFIFLQAVPQKLHEQEASVSKFRERKELSLDKPLI